MTKVGLKYIFTSLALALAMGSVDDPSWLSASTESRSSKTPTQQPGSKVPAKNKATSTASTSGKMPVTKSDGQSKSKKPRLKGRSSSKTSKKRRIRGQREIDPSRILEIQQALRSAGYYKEEPTGKWDSSTSQAMSAYQTDNGFKVTGKPDALSLKKLGL